jgi:HlyD family secretion protein
MFTIVNDLTQMEVQTSVDEADIGQVNQGQRVEFTVDAYPDLKFEGLVSQVRLQPVTTNNVVTYVVILNAPNPDKKLMPGMTASATIYVDENADALILSGKAMRFTPDKEYMQKVFAERMKKMPKGSSDTAMPTRGAGTMPQGMPTGTNAGIPSGEMFPAAGHLPEGIKTVWVKDDKYGLRPVPVKIGIDNGTNVEILTGLKEGDEVIISMSGGTTEKAGLNRNNEGPKGPLPFQNGG